MEFLDIIKSEHGNSDLTDLHSITFNDIFKFRGLLGQGSYGIVIMVQDKIQERIFQDRVDKEQKIDPLRFPRDSAGKIIGKSFALKIINKQVLNQEEIKVIRGESKILNSLVGKDNVVQFKNIFETAKFIIIQMEHLKGNSMKRELKLRMSEAQRKVTNDDSEEEQSNI